MSADRHRIYCAGPLFTEKEREEMEQIATALEHAGYDTFLPHRDGLELTRCVDHLEQMGKERAEACKLLSRAIFALDVFEVLRGCDALMANLNGRVPDEGTVSEASMAWSRDKLVVGYKADGRTVLNGEDNPLVAGLFGFRLWRTIDEAVEALGRSLNAARHMDSYTVKREEEIASYIELGGEIASALRAKGTIEDILDVIIRLESETLTM